MDAVTSDQLFAARMASVGCIWGAWDFSLVAITASHELKLRGNPKGSADQMHRVYPHVKKLDEAWKSACTNQILNAIEVAVATSASTVNVCGRSCATYHWAAFYCVHTCLSFYDIDYHDADRFYNALREIKDVLPTNPDELESKIIGEWGQTMRSLELEIPQPDPLADVPEECRELYGHIEQEGPISWRDLLNRTGTSQKTLKPFRDRLEKLGWIRQVREGRKAHWCVVSR